MGDTIQVEVVDRLTGARRVESCRLPLEIGKKPEAASHILLDAKYPTISRIHGRLEQRGAVLVYVDCSSNGTTIAGELLKGRDLRTERRRNAADRELRSAHPRCRAATS